MLQVRQVISLVTSHPYLPFCRHIIPILNFISIENIFVGVISFVNNPYRNDKVVTRLWSPCNLVTTLRQPCHNLVVYSQSLCNLAATLSNPSQGCDNLVTTLRQPCHDLVVFSQSHCNLAATLSNPSQGCHKVVKLATTLPQPCSIPYLLDQTPLSFSSRL